MEEAHSWVSMKAPEDELYCWSEGFDDWLPTEKVSHFRGIRADSFSDLGSPEEQTMMDGAFPFAKPVETPKPLFAATMEAVAKNEAVDVDDELHMPSSVAPWTPNSIRSGATAAVGSTRRQPKSSSHTSVHACASD